MAAGFGVAVLVAHLLGEPHGVGGVALFWVAVIGASTAAVIVVDSQARRLLPLAALLRLSLVFPDRAPSRFGVALRAGSIGRLRERAQAVGDSRDAAHAARQILVLAGALARHDSATRGHSERVRAYTDLLAEQLDLSEHDADRLRWSALLHDVGKLVVSHDVLNKHDSLDAAEWDQVRRHPAEGARIARPLRKWLGVWTLAIAQHHERWDGSGYPRGLSAKKIAKAARIVAVADAFDVMTAARSYRTQPMRAGAAREELAACAGTDFDPEIVRAFLEISLGRLRWVLGIGGLFALPLIPRGTTRPARNVVAGGIATAAALGAGLLPLQATPPTQVLGEQFSRRPAASVAEPAPSAGELAPGPAGTTTTTGPSPTFTVVTTTSTTPARQPGAKAPAIVQPPPATTSTTSAKASTTTTRVPPPPGPKVAVDDVVAQPVKGGIDIKVLANDSEPGGTLVPKSVSIVVAPLHGTATAHDDGQVHYEPAPHYVGPDSFIYSVCDTAGQCFTAQVTLTVATH